MTASGDTVVFIPAWNEEENLPGVLDELAEGLPGVDVLVVDDGSTDTTATVARDRDATVVSFGENRGLRAGIAAGYREALARDYSYCGRVDADGQHPVAELRRLIELVRSGSCDVAIGSRFAVDDDYADGRYRPSASRRFGIGLLQRAMRVRLGRRFHDPTSGLVAANAAAMIVLAEPYLSGAPEVEALMRLDEVGLRVEEVAVDMRQRVGGESKLQGKKAVTLVATVIVALLFFDLRRRRRS
ncbi:MAG: glycosyltransferase family 2 protein [Actinomycetia bacterium]|nr:glycosyltransferase family 2 protein [Actinomycetes bacterium]MCP5034284.1 glycosyltransferase family 2 protein [Actinomycetes bacterium]